jgi:hypothetical protein
MVLRWSVVLVLALQGAPADPRAVVAAATHAVERDSISILADRWSRALATDSTDRPALLGLGTLARLSYDYGRAAPLYTRLFTTADDRFAVYAWIGQAEADRIHGTYAAAAAGHRRRRPGHVRRLAGKRPTGIWADAAWLISKTDAHVTNGVLVADTPGAREVLKDIGPARLVSGSLFRGHPRRNAPERAKPTPAQRRARAQNIRKAQAARRTRGS